MLNDSEYEEKCRKMIEAEEEVMNNIPNKSLDSLIALFHISYQGILDNKQRVELILSSDIRNKKYGEEVLFSTFRVIKAVLAEIEYRIKENII